MLAPFYIIVCGGAEQATVQTLDQYVVGATPHLNRVLKIGRGHDAEIRNPSEIKSEFTRPRISGSKLKLAEDLTAKWHDDEFDYSKYKDHYQQKVKEDIRSPRLHGKPAGRASPNFHNLDQRAAILTNACVRYASPTRHEASIVFAMKL